MDAAAKYLGHFARQDGNFLVETRSGTASLGSEEGVRKPFETLVHRKKL